MYVLYQTDLGHVDTALLEGAVVGIVGTHVSVFAPVAWKGAVHTGETPIEKRQWEKKSIIQMHSISNHDISTWHTHMFLYEHLDFGALHKYIISLLSEYFSNHAATNPEHIYNHIAILFKNT